MPYEPSDILAILDRGCDSFNFPMLDNGYVYLAASRLSLYRSADDWALVFEIFGFSPRSGVPDLNVTTFASTLHDRDSPEQYVSEVAYLGYLARKPNNDARFFYPIEGDAWVDMADDGEFIAEEVTELSVRGQSVSLPPLSDYAAHGINLSHPGRVTIFELCRMLTATRRDLVLGTMAERRVSVPPQLDLIMTLDDWRHPDLLEDERPGTSETFQQIAEVLVSGNVNAYHPTQVPNTHWSFWPEGGLL